MTAAQVQNLLSGLRLKTGLRRLHFDKDGFLDPGDRTASDGGSATARALIFAAIDGLNCFKLENHDYSAGVAFAQIRATEVVIEDATKIRHEVFHIEVDFHDFRELRGNDEVLAAFDPTIHLLHELGHGALGLRDTIGRTDLLGDCERHINQIRRELGLPERQRYESQMTMAVIPGDTFTSLKAQLTFVRSENTGRNAKEFPLYFKADNVYLATTLKGGSQAGRCVGLQAPRR